MTHPLISHLRFARHEFARCMEGVTPEDGLRRLEPMNCLSWIVGHMASQEHRYWVEVAQGKHVAGDLYEYVSPGADATTPDWDHMWAIWRTVTAQADLYLETVQNAELDNVLSFRGKAMREPVGALLMRNIYHYWFHTGEAHAIRQSLGHWDLPQFVGDISMVDYGISR